MSYSPLDQKQTRVPSYPSDAWEKANVKTRSHERVVAWVALGVVGLMVVLTLIVAVR